MPLVRGLETADLVLDGSPPKAGPDADESFSEEHSAVPGDTGGAGERIGVHEGLPGANRGGAAVLVTRVANGDTDASFDAVPSDHDE